MPDQNRALRPGPKPGTFLDDKGALFTLPPGWVLLPPGDAGVTRRVKAGGPSWTVAEKVGRKLFSRGVAAPAARIEAVKRALVAERAEPAYEKKRAADAQRRVRAQAAYELSFDDAVKAFLAFAPRYAALATELAARVTAHATPVGSGTVARTERIPIDERAEAAVIAWMRHQTTGYDDMHIPRVKGMRREVRRELAQRSHRLLDAYRRGVDIDARCPLQRALGRGAEVPSAAPKERAPL